MTPLSIVHLQVAIPWRSRAANTRGPSPEARAIASWACSLTCVIGDRRRSPLTQGEPQTSLQDGPWVTGARQVNRPSSFGVLRVKRSPRCTKRRAAVRERVSLKRRRRQKASTSTTSVRGIAGESERRPTIALVRAVGSISMTAAANGLLCGLWRHHRKKEFDLHAWNNSEDDDEGRRIRMTRLAALRSRAFVWHNL